MKKIISLALVLLMLMALVACSPKEENIVGVWTAELEFSKITAATGKDASSTDPDMAELFKDIKMKVILDIRDDGIVYVKADTEGMITQLMAALKENLTSILAKQSGKTEAEIASLMEQQGITADSLVDQIASSFDMSQYKMDDIERRYKYENGTLYLSDPAAQAGEYTTELSCTLKGDTLTVTGIKPASANGEDLESYKSVLPIVFSR